MDVIDGQQRLSTVTIIILAALDILRYYINTNQNINKEEEKVRYYNDVNIPHQDTKLKSNKYIEKAFDNFHKKLLEYF